MGMLRKRSSPRKPSRRPFFSFAGNKASGSGDPRRFSSLTPPPAMSPDAEVRRDANNLGKKKSSGSRIWMRLDRSGNSEVFESDKSAIIKLAAIPSRDLRILGSSSSQSSRILAREKAIVVNLEFIKAIVMSDEVLILDPLCQDVLPFVDQLSQQIFLLHSFRIQELDNRNMRNDEISSALEEHLHNNEATEGDESELPFEFQVLEIVFEVVCSYLESRVAELEIDAYPLLDDLTKNVSTKNLQHVRSLKSNVTRLLARVQKVRDEIEHLLDDDQDMAALYLSRKQTQNQQFEALMAAGALDNTVGPSSHFARLYSTRFRSSSLSTSAYMGVDDVEELEMLLETYFVQLDGIRNRILSVREYIDDTEDYVNIRLDHHRNELIQLHIVLNTSMVGTSIDMLFTGIFAMNLPFSIAEQSSNSYFTPYTIGMTLISFLFSFVILVRARWKKLL